LFGHFYLRITKTVNNKYYFFTDDKQFNGAASRQMPRQDLGLYRLGWLREL
jgi:hypothetical protein